MTKKGLLFILLDFFELLFTVTTIVFVVFIFVGQLLEVSGASMVPNFHDKEQLIVEKISIKFNPPKRGEVLIFKYPITKSHLVIKRVVGVPNDTVLFSQGMLYINGEKFNEPYLVSGTPTYEGAKLRDGIDYKIPENEYLMLGDNRAQSTDSRTWGFLSSNLIVGRVFVVYYPFKDFRFGDN